MFAADAQLDIGSGRPALPGCHLNELSHAILIQFRERIRLVNLAFVIVRQELACVVTGEPEGHLRQVVGSKEKNSASSAISFASNAARGISIMVPM